MRWQPLSCIFCKVCSFSRASELWLVLVFREAAVCFRRTLYSFLTGVSRP